MWLKEKLNYKPEIIPDTEGNLDTYEDNMHLFRNWQQYLESNFNKISRSTIERCNTQCQYESIMASGRNVVNNDLAFDKCTVDCNSEWAGKYSTKKNELLFQAEKDFKNCIGNQTRQMPQLGEQEILHCKKESFMKYMEDFVDFEQSYLTDSLNKFI